MKKSARALILTLTVLAATHPLGAQGFKAFELGARAAGLGGAFVARADDASAVFFNPAGLAFQPGFRFKFDISYNISNSTARALGSGMAYTNDSARFTGNPYIVFTVKDFISFGIGYFSANWMRTSWSDNTFGSLHGNISTVSSTYVRPVLAVKILRYLALGAGVDFVVARQAWDHDMIFTFEATSPGRILPALSRTSVEGEGVGFTAGWLFKPSDRFGFGGKVTSRVGIDLKGTTDFDSAGVFRSPPRGLATRAKMAIPEEIVVGLRALPLKNLAVHLDYQRIGMSGAMDWTFDVAPTVYDDIERLVGFRPDEAGFGADLVLRNTSRIMCGIEYVTGKAFAVRAGYSRQESSVDDDNLRLVFPDLAMDVLSLGVGYEGPFFDLANRDKKLGGLSVDASIQYGRSPGRTSKQPDFPAFFKGNRWSFGIGAGFVF